MNLCRFTIVSPTPEDGTGRSISSITVKNCTRISFFFVPRLIISLIKIALIDQNQNFQACECFQLMLTEFIKMPWKK